MAELRADLFEREGISAEAREFREECRQRLGRTLETVLTIRLRRDGGAWPDDEAGRRASVWRALDLQGPDPVCDWIDVEAEEFPLLDPEVRAILTTGKPRLLLSHHEMAGSLPRARLRALMRDMAAFGPDGMKVAVTCADRKELLDLLDFSREVAAATPNGCVLSMGSAGRSSRVLAPLLGCPLTYGYLSGGAVAPGQLSVRQLDGFFRAMPAEGAGAIPDGQLVDWAEARIPGELLAK